MQKPYPLLAKRVGSELRELNAHPTEGVYVTLSPDDKTDELLMAINGPSGTPYEGGVFWFRADLRKGYPFHPPKITLLTKVYHPAFPLPESKMCCCNLPVLGAAWTARQTIGRVCEALRDLLSNPAEDACGNLEILEEFRTDPETFQQNARVWTLEYA